MPRLFVCSLFVCWGAAFVAPAFGQETPVKWERIKFEDAFRAEGVAVGDFNKDGRLDITNGEAWYEAPGDANLYKAGHWTMRQVRPEGIRRFNNDGNYSQSFAVWSHDISGDGWQDIIVIGFPGEPCRWFENPQKQPGPWNQYEIWHSAAGESPQFLDVTGDGKPELVMTSEPEQMMGYLEVPSPEMAKKKWDYKQVSGEKLGGLAHRYYHGLGVGDLNRDGKQDILIPAGWWEQPISASAGPWTFHKHTLSPNGEGGSHAAADMYADDLDGDGDNDIMMSSAHAHGIWWFENKGEGKFQQHEIDKSYSQTHAMHYQDVNGDGTKDLITGKRFYAHGSKGDPDALGEVVMYWYEVKKGEKAPPTFIPHKIDAGSDTGVGTQFFVGDINGDKLLDIVSSNKKGTNVLLQKR